MPPSHPAQLLSGRIRPNAPVGPAPFRDSGAFGANPYLGLREPGCTFDPIARSRPGRHGVGLVASPGQAAQSAEALLRRRYSWADADKAETLVALGGDGFMLQTLHSMLEDGEARPVFGMNRGTFGF